MNKNSWDEFPNMAYEAKETAHRISDASTLDVTKFWDTPEDYALDCDRESANEYETELRESCRDCGVSASSALDENLWECASGIVKCIECLKGAC